MTHTYTVDGMSCSGCADNVKNNLLKHPDVVSAEVDLNTKKATITMKRHLEPDELQNAIGRDSVYRIRPQA